MRQKKVSETIKKAVAEIIMRDLADPRVRFASVNRVEISADLLHAKIFISIIGEEAEQRTVFRGIQSAAGFIRNELRDRINLRFLPKLQFIHDQSVEKAIEISKLIDEIAEERRERESNASEEREDGAVASENELKNTDNSEET
ncbi:MAG: 30S ribosome-binding factor RbfA [Planctomycetota bacterium]|jgi:ribosome-binding factor A